VDEETRRLLPESARKDLDRTERIAETLVGQTERAATEAAEAQGITVRIASREGESFPLRADMRFSRVNLVIERGVVTQARAS
jgi:hypothetical protein